MVNDALTNWLTVPVNSILSKDLAAVAVVKEPSVVNPDPEVVLCSTSMSSVGVVPDAAVTCKKQEPPFVVPAELSSSDVVPVTVTAPSG